MVDPEPISIALELFAALAGAAGLTVQTVYFARERSQDAADLRKHLFTLDRSMNRVDEAHRSLISVYDENEILLSPITLGRSPMFVDERMRSELDRLPRNIFYGGPDLQNALTEISTKVDRSDSETSLQIARQPEEVFQSAQSNRLLEFMIEIGRMLELVSAFLYGLGEEYAFGPTSTRLTLIRGTVQNLRIR